MGTCCNASEGMEGEEGNEARDIDECLAARKGPRSAGLAVLDQWFWESCRLESPRRAALEKNSG